MKLPAPRISGGALRALVRATGAAPVRRAVGALVRSDLRFGQVRALPASARDALPLSAKPLQARLGARSVHDSGLSLPDHDREHVPTSAHFTEAYAARRTTPLEVVRHLLEAARGLRARGKEGPPRDPFLALDEAGALRDAEASTKRWRDGHQQGPLDGVPVPIKEEVDLAGMGARLGMARAGDPHAKDATVAARLRASGAILVGHTVMTEYGMSPLGVSSMRDLPHNAVAPGHAAGGSSTGSGVAVSLGLAPVAVGSDGGGSIRIPASWQGLYGIKPTFGRVSRQGDGFGGTMAHLGPIGASTRDLAIFLEATSGQDRADELTWGNPGFESGWLQGALGRGVRGMRIGVLSSEIDAAQGEVARACREALAALAREGAELVEVHLDHAEHAPTIGYATIGLEAYTALREERASGMDALGPDLTLLCRVMSTLSSDDYLDAQCLRAGLRRDVASVLRDVDVLALPTTAAPPPRLKGDDARGMIDTVALAQACRFAFLGNLTGLPAGTAPVGASMTGAPFGLQIVGDAWDEASVLAVLAHLERTGVASVPKPTEGVRLL